MFYRGLDNVEPRVLPLLLATWLVLIFLPAPSSAVTYRYTDDGGVLHFTNKMESIPGKYRERAEAVEENARPDGYMPPEEMLKDEGGGRPLWAIENEKPWTARAYDRARDFLERFEYRAALAVLAGLAMIIFFLRLLRRKGG
jgi:hypothetical protein